MIVLWLAPWLPGQYKPIDVCSADVEELARDDVECCTGREDVVDNQDAVSADSFWRRDDECVSAPSWLGTSRASG